MVSEAFSTLWPSRKGLIAHIIDPQQHEDHMLITLQHCVRGDVLWSIAARVFADGRPSERYIRCNLLSVVGGGSHSWTHIALTEATHPQRYSCPLGYLDEVPEQNAEWRKRVREFRQQHSREKRRKWHDDRKLR